VIHDISTPKSSTCGGKSARVIPIELYHLHWSHYVEKVRWALDFKGIPWRGIEINAFSKKEIRKFNKGEYVPLIFDPNTQVVISDSTPILRYLDEAYQHKPLFPSEPTPRAEVLRWTLMFDSFLGLRARRLGYAQLIVEAPELLHKLFLPRILGGLLTYPGISYIATVVVAAVLTIRFRLHRNREDEVFEGLEAFLIQVAAHIEGRKYVVGSAFTAADLALAALLRPLRIVPFFRNHSKLHSLFDWQRLLFVEHGREQTLIYEDAIEAVRRRRGYVRGHISWLQANSRSVQKSDASRYESSLEYALNDQRPVYNWRLLLIPALYLKVRWFSGVRKQSLAETAA
jgi:glutathione S-transferase